MTAMPADHDLKRALVEHYRWLRRYGINDSHSGNASVRDGQTVWVTPTGACADTLQPEQLVACRVPGQAGPGAAPGASLDAPLHLAVYRRSPQTGAVLHSHGPYTVALTFAGEDFIPQDFEGQLYFPRVPVITLPFQEYVARAPEEVSARLTDHPIVVVRGHGVYAQAETLELAYKWTCSLEQSAKTAFIARQAGTLAT